MSPLQLLPIAALVLAIGAATVQTVRLQSLRAEVAEAATEQAESARMAERRVSASHNRIDQDAAQRTDLSRVSAVRAAIAGDGLRQRAAAVASVAASDAGRCPDAAGAASVLADLPGRMDEAGRAVAAHADALATALSACQAAYGALTP